MGILVVASSYFVLIHFLIAGTALRDKIVESIGEARFRLLFSTMAAVGLVAMVMAYSRADRSIQWFDLHLDSSEGLIWLFMIGNLLAIMMLTVGVLSASPNSVLTEKAFRQGRIEINGILRITRHPGMLGIGLWSVLHMLASGDAASLVFFGSLAVLALLGPLSMDRKKLRLEGDRYAQVLNQTSYLPFVAIIQGRNRLVLSEIGWLKAALSLVLFIALVYVHRWIAGVALI